MQEEYIGRLLEDGHLSIPKDIVNKLKIDKDSELHVVVKIAEQAKRAKILSYAGLLADLSPEEENQLSASMRRKSMFGQRKTEL